MKNDDTAARSRSGEETRTLDLGAGETWLSVEQEVNRDLVGSLQILESFTGTAEGKRHHAKKVRDLFARLRASVPNTGTALSVREMQAINARRSARWMAGSPGWTTLEIAGELAGEVGELANVCKKLRRSEMGVPGNKVSDEVLFQQARGEMADVMIVLMLTASKLGIDLQDAVCATFNAKSEQMGFPERLSSAPSRGSDSDERTDTALIDWLEAEHTRVDPVARLVVKRGRDRNSSEWADVSHDVRGTLQSLAAGKPEPRRLRQVRPHTPGPGYICALCNASHVLGCRDGRVDNARCPSAPLVTESAGGTNG